MSQRRSTHSGEVGQLVHVLVGGQARLALLPMRQQPGLAQFLGNAVLQAGGGRDVEPAPRNTLTMGSGIS